MAYAVVRSYKGSTELIDELERRSDEVESLIRGISGFISYVLVRSHEGGFSVSVYEDQAGGDESIRKAREYIQTNLSGVTATALEVLQGESVIHFTAD